MKRSAEAQLTKDNANQRNSEDDDEPGRGIIKADEEVLARRPIRGLPKRSTGGIVASAPAPNSNPEAPKVSRFAGFTGFGSSGSSNPPFSFEIPSPSSSMDIKSAPPAVAPNATKIFASLVGESSLTSQPLSSQPPESAPGDKTDEDGDEVLSITEYFKALRGLNRSFLSAMDEAVKSDSFVDLTGYFDHYRTLRSNEKKKYDEAIRAIKKDTLSSPFTEPGSDIAKSPLAMPAPPKTFSGFGGFPAPSTNTSNGDSSSGGFTFKPTPSASSTPSPFSLPTAASSDKEDAPKASHTFGGSSASSASSPSPFLFGTGSTISSSSSNLFGAPSSSTPSIFGSNLFGGSSTTSSKSEVEKSSAGSSAANIFGSSIPPLTKPVTSVSNNTAFTFGGPISSTSTSSAALSSEGGDSNNSIPLFTGFGKTQSGSGSIGNPVGFGFGNPSASSSVNPFGAALPTINANGSSSKDGDISGSAAGSAFGSQESTPALTSDADRDPAQLMKQTTSVHDREGEGEENEETLHQARSKVFKLGKNESGSQGWNDLGIGMLRVKQHKETGARRLLLRNSSTGKIVINFNIYTGMTPSVTKNTVSFVGHDNSELAAQPGLATPFKLRLKTEGEAIQLKNALDRAIEFVTSKSD